MDTVVTGSTSLASRTATTTSSSAWTDTKGRLPVQNERMVNHRQEGVVYRSNSQSQCRYGRKQTTHVDNKDSTFFGSRIGRTPNPLTFTFNQFTVKPSKYTA